ncbi:MAG: RNA polymerase sigma factor [Clostridiaceae bacterium]|nr:RNA polymerase sigma factor [Clostridiaceae bacterium]
MRDDESLYREYLEGNEDGLAELIERYGTRLTLYIHRYIHDIHDAEDLMIDVFAYLAVKKPRIRPGAFKAYIYKSAWHAALRFLAQNKLRHCLSLDEMEYEPRGEDRSDDLALTNERNDLLSLCMERLKPDYRQALYLVYFEQLRHAEAAEVMGKSEKQIADLVYRGKKSLRKRLEEEGVVNAEY